MIQSLSFWLLVALGPPVYWLLPARLRMGALSIASALFLAQYAPWTVASLAAWSIAFYYLLRLPRGAAATATILIGGILLQLAAFKYIPPMIEALTSGSAAGPVFVPIGMSFFSFKLVHYAVEQRRGTLPPHSFAEFVCYLYLFPTFTAGPIERFDHFAESRESRCSLEAISIGVTRIAVGLVKKLVIAEILIVTLMRGHDIESVLAGIGSWPAYYLWAFLALSFLYVYMDFSGYCDIAIGTSRLFGIRIMENFNWPIFATNIGNFWKRWHMTLAGWCQTYVYLPTIGLTRNPYLAVYATFVAIGLWHAGTLNYLAWGLYQATGVSSYLWFSRFKRRRRWTTPSSGLRRWWGVPATFLFMSVGYCFTTTSGHGIAAAGRLLAKLAGVDIASD